MSELIEAMARAMWQCNIADGRKFGVNGLLPFDEEPQALRDHWLALAAAGIQAIQSSGTYTVGPAGGAP